jgi:hypothetical protein
MSIMIFHNECDGLVYLDLSSSVSLLSQPIIKSGRIDVGLIHLNENKDEPVKLKCSKCSKYLLLDDIIVKCGNCGSSLPLNKIYQSRDQEGNRISSFYCDSCILSLNLSKLTSVDKLFKASKIGE